MNRKVKIIFKPEVITTATGEQEPFQKPPFETTENNLPNQERLHGDKIKEIIYADEKGKYPEKKPIRSSVFKPKVTIADITPEIREQIINEHEKALSSYLPSKQEITNEILITEFRKRGKTDLSIAKYLEMDVNEVKRVG